MISVNNKLLKSAKAGILKDVSSAIKHGADVNIQDNEGWTALLHASDQANIDCVVHLIDKGADTNLKANNGYSVLHAIAYQSDLELLKYLISRGANVNDGDQNGSTALHHAVDGYSINCVKYLVEHGADPLQVNINGITPLDQARYEIKNCDVDSDEEIGYQQIIDYLSVYESAKIEQTQLDKLIQSKESEFLAKIDF